MENRKLILEISTPDGKVKNSYEVSYPTVGQMIDIEATKLALSKGKYTEMIMAGGLAWMTRALDCVDMLSYFSVMCPKIIQDAKVDLSNLDLMDAHKGLMQAYKDKFVPWWNDYSEMISKLESGEPLEEDDKGAEG